MDKLTKTFEPHKINLPRKIPLSLAMDEKLLKQKLKLGVDISSSA